MYKMHFQTSGGFSVGDKVSAQQLYHNAKLQVERSEKHLRRMLAVPNGVPLDEHLRTALHPPKSLR